MGSSIDDRHIVEVKGISLLDDMLGKAAYFRFPLLGVNWCLRIYPGGQNQESKGRVCVFLFKDSGPSVRVCRA